jgi:hypothetical protein
MDEIVNQTWITYKAEKLEDLLGTLGDTSQETAKNAHNGWMVCGQDILFHWVLVPQLPSP